MRLYQLEIFAIRWTEMVLFYSEASFKLGEDLQLFWGMVPLSSQNIKSLKNTPHTNYFEWWVDSTATEEIK